MRVVALTTFASGLFFTVSSVASAQDGRATSTDPQIPSDVIKTELLPFYNDNWSIFADGTVIYQGFPSFHAAYNGAQSFPSSRQANDLEVLDLSIGRRLWAGAEFYIDPQFYPGYGVGSTIGIAGFPDGEANKGGSEYIYPEIARAFVRQTFNLGGVSETIERGANQLGETEAVSRLTMTAGKFSFTDQFDGNSYSHDPETQFMNWSFEDSIAWDWAQDSKGYAWGAVLELNQKDWALRYGAMIPVNEINGDRFRLHGGNELDNAVELEERYTISSRPGKTRILIFYNRERAGNFADAVLVGGDINSAIASTREYGRVEYGFAINLEQQVMDDLGTFARISWNNGANENLGFTQANEGIALGLSLQGKRWQRDDDVLGLAVAVNGISSDQRKALQAGYTSGLIIGDGTLSYSGETIVETYYNYNLAGYASIGPDYQFVVNPAYNTDRGPVHIFALRANAKF